MIPFLCLSLTDCYTLTLLNSGCDSFHLLLFPNTSTLEVFAFFVGSLFAALSYLDF